MKSLKILTVAALSSLIALTSVADISLTGNGRYRLGFKDTLTKAQFTAAAVTTAASTADDQNYRDGRIRLTVRGGTDSSGVQARLQQNFNTDGSGANDTQALQVTQMRANTTIGGVSISMGNNDKYAGLLGTYYGGGEFTSDNAVTIFAGNPGTFAGWVAHELGEEQNAKGNAVMKSDFIHYGFLGSFQGISFNYVARPNAIARDNVDISGATPAAGTGGVQADETWGFAPFQDLTVSGTFGGATVEFNTGRSDADNSDATIARVSVPVSGLTVKLGYAKLEGGYQNQDAGTVLGEGIFTSAYGQASISGAADAANSAESDADIEEAVSTANTTYTGLAVAGSMGNISYQVTGGTYDDNVKSTSDSFYSIDASYSLDASTTLKFGTGKAYGRKGMGVEVNYAF